MIFRKKCVFLIHVLTRFRSVSSCTGSSCISCTDTGFIMENIKKMADHIQVVIERVKDSSQKEQIKRYFTSKHCGE